jgi:hypothetical protein
VLSGSAHCCIAKWVFPNGAELLSDGVVSAACRIV